MPESNDEFTREEIQRARQDAIFDIYYRGDATGDSDVDITEEQIFEMMSILRLSELRLDIRDRVESLREEASEDMKIVKEELTEKYNVDMSEFDEIEDIEDIQHAYRQGVIIDDISGEMTEFIVISQVLIEQASVDLLKKELIDERYSDSNKTDDLINRRMSQNEREELLLRTGIIDAGLKSNLSEIRTTRNNLAHKMGESVLLKSIDDVSSQLDKTMETVNEIRSMCNDNLIEVEVS